MTLLDRPVRGSSSGRPIMALLDLLGRRWTLRIVWELREQPRRFRELQDLIGASPTIVNTRLAELREAKLVELDEATGLTNRIIVEHKGDYHPQVVIETEKEELFSSLGIDHLVFLRFNSRGNYFDWYSYNCRDRFFRRDNSKSFVMNILK